MAKFEDISTDPEYFSIVGKEFTTKKDLLIFGYTLKLEKEKNLNGYTVQDYPGIGGAEIMSREVLKAGTSFTVEKIEQCRNCFPFSAYIDYIIRFQELTKYNKYRVDMGKELFNKVSTKTHNKPINFAPSAPDALKRAGY